jgi:hypothetical protein
MTLTARQREVAILARSGLSNKQIGRQLSISPHTVDSHLRTIYIRLDAANRKALPMPLPYAAQELPADLVEAGTLISTAEATIAALPGTPVEADLPDIVQAITDLSAAITAIKGVADTMATILATTRINQ